MIGIAKRYNVALKDLAKANRVEPHAQVKMGDRLVIPGRLASAKPPVLAAKPRTGTGAGPTAVQGGSGSRDESCLARADSTPRAP